MGKLKQLLREPLVHFLVIGAFVFGAHSLWTAQQSADERTISVSAGQVERLAGLWASEAGRPPTPEEVKTLIAEYVREEVLYREALRLGLDREDTIIRRRLAQKMGFVFNNGNDAAPLGDAELRALFEADREAYARASRISFVHVPFNFTEGQQADQNAMREALLALSGPDGTADPSRLGDPFLLSRTHTDLSEAELGRLFGKEFASTIFALEAEGWSGPHRSRLAWHLVRVEKLEAGGVPRFEDIIETVRARETARQTRAANEAEMSKLLERYTVVLNGDTR